MSEKEYLVNITQHARNGLVRANPRMSGRSVECLVRITKFDETGSLLEIQETTVREAVKARMRSRGSRKQIAARANVPTASITIVPKPEEPKHPAEVFARLNGKTEVEAKIAGIEARIQDLLNKRK